MNATIKSAQKSSKGQVKASKAPVAHGVGRRKAAVARVWLRRGNGAIVVNGRPYAEYFSTEVGRKAVVEPASVYAALSQYDVEVNVVGGGINGQAGAVRLGISRAVGSIDERARQVLRSENMMTVDARVKERKKYGQKAARRKFQFVKR